MPRANVVEKIEPVKREVIRLPAPGAASRASREELENVQTPLSGHDGDEGNRSVLIGTRTKFVTVYSPVGSIQNLVFRSSRVNRHNLETDYLTKVYSTGVNRGYRVFYTESELKGYMDGYVLEESVRDFECPIDNCSKALGTLEKLRDHLYYFHRREYNSDYKEAIELVTKQSAKKRSEEWMIKMGYDIDNDLDKKPSN